MIQLRVDGGGNNENIHQLTLQAKPLYQQPDTFAIPIFAPAPQWMVDARCRELPVAEADSILFAEGRPSNRVAQLCDPCPVKVQCLAAGMDEQDGYWGGFSSNQRRAMRREKAA